MPTLAIRARVGRPKRRDAETPRRRDAETPRRRDAEQEITSDCRRMTDEDADKRALLDLRTRYAFDWFSFHATQRFAAFNFFLVALGAVTVAYATAVTDRSKALGVGIAVVLAVVSVAFFGIDLRNARIVEIARSELAKLEPELGVTITRTAESERKLLKTHRFWLRAILFIATLVSLAAIAWAVDDFGYAAHPTRAASAGTRQAKLVNVSVLGQSVVLVGNSDASVELVGNILEHAGSSGDCPVSDARQDSHREPRA
jgi:hypothetical protein